MRQFVTYYPNFQIVLQAVAQLPWGHIVADLCYLAKYNWSISGAIIQRVFMVIAGRETAMLTNNWLSFYPQILLKNRRIKFRGFRIFYRVIKAIFVPGK